LPLRFPAQEAEEIVRVRTDLATVTVYAADRRGRRVAGLKQTDFLLYDGDKPLAIEHFATGTERVALCFLLDASGSVRDIMQHEREAALALFARFGRGSRLAVMRFGANLQTLAPFTDDVNLLRRAVLAPPASTGRTALFDGATAALKAFAANARPAERRIAILISDGLDNASRSRARDVAVEANKLGVSFYVLHWPLYEPRDGRLQPRAPSKGFKELAEQTGGRYFRLGSAQDALNPRAEYDLRPVFQALADDLAAQYILGHYPRDGRRPAFKVELIPSRRGSLRVNLLP
jgi:VWFA-related protein